ncbi:MAG: hypothetical protein H0A75_07965 [Candidatus Methanofishera endochildressiae]|uniref:Uncharacterized protein n=1 Tax=Candidatus Methanofishera endochildressiae TaxID=2738884 RepID=A0A7Z0MPH9_9GAMM|nr:hypothetical protein [Candidatus Methanofishera endochildressiae]
MLIPKKKIISSIGPIVSLYDQISSGLLLLSICIGVARWSLLGIDSLVG